MKVFDENSIKNIKFNYTRIFLNSLEKKTNLWHLEKSLWRIDVAFQVSISTVGRLSISQEMTTFEGTLNKKSIGP